MIALVWHLREAGLQLRKDLYNGIIRLSESGVYLQCPPSAASESGIYHMQGENREPLRTQVTDITETR